MTANTSGLTQFSMDVDDILRDALDPLGGEYETGQESNRARSRLNLVLIKLQNRNIPLNKLDVIEVPLSATVDAYPLDFSVLDVLECNYKDTTSTTETPLAVKGLREWHQIPNKNADAKRPTSYTLEHSRNGVELKVWPIPNATTDGVLSILVSKRIEDVTASYQKIDLHPKYLPLVVAWLSYDLSLTRPGIPADVRQQLKMDLEEIKSVTFDADAERVDLVVRPGGISGR